MAPDMNDTGYLDEAADEAGGWPSNDERDQVKEQMQEDIDNDPRPDTAKEFVVTL